jgi:hypothetical protein
MGYRRVRPGREGQEGRESQGGREKLDVLLTCFSDSSDSAGRVICHVELKKSIQPQSRNGNPTVSKA